jgi:hypothetical protein
LKGKIDKFIVTYFYKGIWYTTVDGGKTWKNTMDVTPCEKVTEF